MTRPGRQLEPPASRGAFTLVELLVAIAILAIVASLIIGVGAVAQETAREAKTQAALVRIHHLLMDRYDSYRNRRVGLTAGATTGATTGQLNAQARLHALRELLMTEMPERWGDVLLGDVSSATLADIADGSAFNNPLYLQQRTAIGRLFARKLQEAAATVTANGGSIATLQENESAECLYLIVMNTTADGEAPGMFSEKVIGDTDGDGAREFLDGWGNPIRFLRWAPGANSPTQLNPQSLTLVAQDAGGSQGDAGVGDAAIAAAVNQDRDPLDLFRVQPYTATDSENGDLFGYRLVPFVYSIGGDEESGINGVEELAADVPWTGANGTTLFTDWPNPFRVVSGGLMGRTTDTDAATDNLSNHLITAKAEN